jgi:hypothetical protein
MNQRVGVFLYWEDSTELLFIETIAVYTHFFFFFDAWDGTQLVHAREVFYH